MYNIYRLAYSSAIKLYFFECKKSMYKCLSNSGVRLNFNLNMKNKIHLKNSKNAKFGREMM